MTKRTRRTFSAEFKLEAAQLVLDQNYTVVEAAKAMGVGKSTMDKWVRQLKQERKGVAPQASPMTPEQIAEKFGLDRSNATNPDGGNKDGDIKAAGEPNDVARSEFSNLVGASFTVTRDWLTLRTAYFQADSTINVTASKPLVDAWTAAGFTDVANNILVDEDKTTPGKLEKVFELFNVPTLIFSENGTEINRIVEFPINGLEQDILAILSGEDYKNAYAE